jgi:hypothetical protein
VKRHGQFVRLIAAGVLMLGIACEGPDGGPKEPPVQRNPDVSESQHDSSPPLREIPPAPHKPGPPRVIPVKPIPHHSPPDAGDAGESR